MHLISNTCRLSALPPLLALCLSAWLSLSIIATFPQFIHCFCLTGTTGGRREKNVLKQEKQKAGSERIIRIKSVLCYCLHNWCLSFIHWSIHVVLSPPVSLCLHFCISCQDDNEFCVCVCVYKAAKSLTHPSLWQHHHRDAHTHNCNLKSGQKYTENTCNGSKSVSLLFTHSVCLWICATVCLSADRTCLCPATHLQSCSSI